MGQVTGRLSEMGIALPSPAAPVANYVPFVVHGGIVTISGQLCFGEDGTLSADHRGIVGADVTIETATAAARLCAINVLAQLQAAVGDLDRVRRCVRLGGFVACGPGFSEHAKVMNGASDLVVAAFEDIGRHARSTIGVSSLPLGACVEIEGQFAVE
jgi:enamine deaminase RidA (YjgF/YER057c/UK114 family)